MLKARIRTAARDVVSLADHVSYLSNKIVFLLDATLGMINIEQNNIIKIFSIAAVVLMPPTLIARRIEDIRDFHARHPGDLVMKPLHGNGGKAVLYGLDQLAGMTEQIGQTLTAQINGLADQYRIGGIRRLQSF